MDDTTTQHAALPIMTATMAPDHGPAVTTRSAAPDARFSFPSGREAPAAPPAGGPRDAPSYSSSESIFTAYQDSASSSRRTQAIPDMAADELAQARDTEAASDGHAHLDIANYPTADLLKMLAALLQHIATSNDQLRPMNGGRVQESVGASSLPNQTHASASHARFLLNDPRRSSITTAALSTLNAPSSTLCFHARHIPSISIEAYLLRILKYCPTTNDVFLSLLVYFDRMSRVGVTGSFPGEPSVGSWAKTEATDEMEEDAEEPTFPGIRGFAIDSYNVHRLVIAGITVASKFFSDVFYTNARYAKVGGLAVHELNQLELHFLLLTDFRLMIPVSEIQQYGDQLLAYANDRSAAQHVARPLPPADRSGSDAETSA